MSYCVECGVKLADSEKSCPLCNTRVVNPNLPDNHDTDRPYPSSVERQMRGLNRRELAWIVLMLLLLPIGATLIIDLLTGTEPFKLTWSIYVLGAGAMLGVWTLMPIMFPKIKPYLHIAVDSLAIAGFLAVIAFQLGSWEWCTHIAIPITAATGVLACVVALIVRAKVLTPMTKASVICAILGLYILALEVIIDFSQGWFSQISWSIYAIVPLLFLSLLLFYVSRKPGLMDELKRRLFV